MMNLRILALTVIILATYNVQSWGQAYISEPHKPVVGYGAKEVVKSLDTQAEFPGNYAEFLAKHLTYPKDAQENEIQGRVVVTFIVEKDGSITNIEFINKLGYGCEEEVTRVLKIMPKWRPAYLDGRPVRSEYRAPISFVLE